MTAPEEVPGAEASLEFEARQPIPWEDPDLPRMPAFFRTLRLVLFRPGEFFRDLSREGWAEPLAFGLILGTVGLLACLYWQVLLNMVIGRLVGGKMGMSQLFTMGTWVIVALMLLSPVISLANLGLCSLCLWGGVALVGVTPAPFSLILRIISYAQGGMAAALIPLPGGLVATLWVLILTYKGVQTAFGLSGGRALGAVAISLALQILVVLLFLGTLLGLISLMGFWVFRG